MNDDQVAVCGKAYRTYLACPHLKVWLHKQQTRNSDTNEQKKKQNIGFRVLWVTKLHLAETLRKNHRCDLQSRKQKAVFVFA